MKFIFYLRDKTVAGTFTNKILLGEPIKPEGNILELYDTVNEKSIGHFDLNFRTGAPICCNENFVCVPSLTEIDGVFSWKTYILDAKDLYVISIIEDCSIKKINSFNYALSKMFDDYKIYNLNEMTLLWKSSLPLYTSISDDKFIFSFGNYENVFKIVCFNIVNGDVVWKSLDLFSLIGHEIKVQSMEILFRHKDTLWLALQDGSCILLDALTGDFIKHIINPNPLAFGLTRYFHCVSGNKMVKLHNQHYHEIDMETHEVRYWHLAELPSYRVLNADDDHIYLLDWKLPKFYTFNIRTRMIDFEWAVPDDHRAQMTSPLMHIKLSDDYVFVSDLDSKFLFVFDKENEK